MEVHVVQVPRVAEQLAQERGAAGKGDLLGKEADNEGKEKGQKKGEEAKEGYP